MTVTCAHCGDVFEARKNARYCSDACRTAAWKARAGYVDHRARKPSRNARSGPSGLQSSFRRTVAETAADYQETFGLTATAARLHAERVIARALSARQRARLEAREG